jgi:hypothetical protein
VPRGFWSDVDILCPNLPVFMAADEAGDGRYYRCLGTVDLRCLRYAVAF